jgi:hypothetical protein
MRSAEFARTLLHSGAADGGLSRLRSRCPGAEQLSAARLARRGRRGHARDIIGWLLRAKHRAASVEAHACLSLEPIALVRETQTRFDRGPDAPHPAVFSAVGRRGGSGPLFRCFDSRPTPLLPNCQADSISALLFRTPVGRLVARRWLLQNPRRRHTTTSRRHSATKLQHLRHEPIVL